MVATVRRPSHWRNLLQYSSEHVAECGDLDGPGSLWISHSTIPAYLQALTACVWGLAPSHWARTLLRRSLRRGKVRRGAQDPASQPDAAGAERLAAL